MCVSNSLVVEPKTEWTQSSSLRTSSSGSRSDSLVGITGTEDLAQTGLEKQRETIAGGGHLRNPQDGLFRQTQCRTCVHVIVACARVLALSSSSVSALDVVNTQVT